MNSNIKKIFRNLFISHLLINITNCLCNIASGYIAGNLLDSIALSCSSIVTPFNSIIFGIASIHSSASEILCGKFMGVGDKKSMNKTFTNSITITTFVGVIITLLSFAFAKPLLLLLGATSEIIGAATSYFYAYSTGIIAILIMPVLVSFLHLENEGKYVTISVILLAVSYAVFGYILISVLKLSYFGFGLTNSLSQIVTVAFLLIKLYKNKNLISFDIKQFNMPFIKNMYILGVSSGTAGMMIGLRNIVLNKVLMQTGGVVALAAYSILGSTVCILDSVITSILQTFIMISSICIGEKNVDDLVLLIKHLFTRIWPIFIVLMTIQLVGARLLCSLFTSEIEVLNTATLLSRLYLPSTIFEILSDTLISIYTILDYKKFANIYNSLHCIIIHALFAILTKPLLHEYSVFLGYLVTEITCAIVLLLFIIRNKKKFPTTFNDFVLLKTDFNVSKYAYTINKAEQIVNISKEITDFCLTNNIDSRRSKLTGLFIEEMITNVFEHGFTKKVIKDKRVDVFVIIENDNINIRIRDNAIAFDPTSRNVIFNPKDPCKNIGLRIVSKLSKETTYQNFFGFNNMIIKI